MLGRLLCFSVPPPFGCFYNSYFCQKCPYGATFNFRLAIPSCIFFGSGCDCRVNTALVFQFAIVFYQKTSMGKSLSKAIQTKSEVCQRVETLIHKAWPADPQSTYQSTDRIGEYERASMRDKSDADSSCPKEHAVNPKPILQFNLTHHSRLHAKMRKSLKRVKPS